MSTPTEVAASEQKSGKRKTHRKSRNGCYQCKQRHTKCNEEHPRCGNCVRLDIHCTWPSRERFSSTYPTPPESHAVVPPEGQVASPDGPAPAFGSDMSISDMRLLHWWTSQGYKNMNIDSSRGHTWQNDCVDLAMDYPFLLRGILALAAVHKVVFGPQTGRQELLLQADAHMSSALETYRRILEDPKEETAMAMFLLSMVIVTYNLAFAKLSEPEDPIRALHDCFRLVQGVQLVMQPHMSHILNSTMMGKLIERGPGTEAATDIPEVLRLKKLAETKRSSAHDFYTTGIDNLHFYWVKTRQCSPENDRMALAMSWPTTLSDQFLQLISAHDPITVVVIAHFAALLTECRLAWWVVEWPSRIVNAAQKVLVATPELLAYLDWPLEIVKAHAEAHAQER